MAFLAFTCEHCKEKSYRFLRPSQVRGAILCPACKKPITSGGVPAPTSAPALTGGQRITCAKTD
jgi:hypothetical protein